MNPHESGLTQSLGASLSALFTPQALAVWAASRQVLEHGGIYASCGPLPPGVRSRTQLLRLLEERRLWDLSPGRLARLAACEKAAERRTIYAATRLPAPLLPPGLPVGVSGLPAEEQAAEMARRVGLDPSQPIRVVLGYDVVDIGPHWLLAYEQITHLCALAEHPNVSLHLIPPGPEGHVPTTHLTELVLGQSRLFFDYKDVHVMYTAGQDAGFARHLMQRALGAALPEEESLRRLKKLADECPRP
ncbi:Scr1 family TA system antitoxin-like transcriptional regulator [Streptomyces sp. NPDC001941]|uniref:Scr1 family TA system antitoxin-like transcriptional regulator n=1 Tax=Streptomyces sp. NPDC001941 TaxID=3154659 RepID=UPI00332F57D4